MFLVYTTDTHHSYKSRDLIAVTKDSHTAITLCKKHAEKKGEVITDEQLWNLENIRQTQGHSFIEYQYEEIKANTLI